jgi:hypothetical protein
VTDLSLHLAPNAPWPILALLSVGLVALALWAYRFAIPPLPNLARRLLPALRVLALLLLVWLLAQPVLERARAARGRRVLVLVDRSRSMDLPLRAGDRETRAVAADRAVEELRRAWRGRAQIDTLSFAGRLATDSAWVRSRGATALGAALEAVPAGAAGREPEAVVVVSDGVVNAGPDPVAAARALGIPVHGVLVGSAAKRDRAVVEIESSSSARVGEPTPVRVRVISSEERSAAIPVRLLDGARELGRATVIAPGGGAEAVAEFRVTPARPGLAVWSAVVDSLAGELTAANNTRQVALQVAPGRLGVLLVSSAPNWDLAFVRRALLGDSSLRVDTRVPAAGAWRALESGRRGAAPTPGDLREVAVVILDGIRPVEIGAEFDRALAGFARNGGGLLVFGGPGAGLARSRGGALGAELALPQGQAALRVANPVPTAEAREVLSWDDDPARGERAWRAAAPLGEVAPVAAAAGDQVLMTALGADTPLMLARRVGRGQALLVNGTGVWRWSLTGHDELGAERGRRLWRRIVRWLAEPVQGEPLRVRPERWLSARGEPVRLFASLQDASFRPLSGASVTGEAQDSAGRSRPIAFAPRGPGSYVAELGDPAPGRYRVTARAQRGGRELGRAASEFAVDRWSLEEVRTDPDSGTLAAVAAAAQGRATSAGEVAGWARRLPARALARPRTESLRLWESPWVFAVVVGALSLEWAWRRRSGLP